VIGRPNVGKSTLINRLLGENRMVAFDQPGTTRDAVLVPFERDGERYTLIDTAGVRRRSRSKRRSRNSASSRPAGHRKRACGGRGHGCPR
jgi:small GTP-binding protein